MVLFFYLVIALAVAFGIAWLLHEKNPDWKDPDEFMPAIIGVGAAAAFWPLTIPLFIIFAVIYLGFNRGKI